MKEGDTVYIYVEIERLVADPVLAATQDPKIAAQNAFPKTGVYKATIEALMEVVETTETREVTVKTLKDL